DMERPGEDGLETGIVSDVLGEDGTPTYRGGSAGTKTTTNEASFYQWYHDSAVSQSANIEIRLQRTPGNEEFYQYVVPNFLPIDVILLGNDKYPKNYH